MNRLAMVLREAAREKGVETAVEVYRTGVREGRINRLDFSLKEAAIAFMGEQWDQELAKFRAVMHDPHAVMRLRESSSVDGVDASSFAAITGQLLIDRVREKYQFATQVGNQIFETAPITNGNLGTQREPWLSRVQDFPERVQPGMPYPTTQYVQQYVDYPGPEKYGQICYVTMEHIYSDLTGQVYESADSVGDLTGMWEEYKKLAVFLGMVNNHSWNGTTYNTYLTSGAWANALTNFTLTDYRSINTLEQLFVGMTDPVTGIPIKISPKNFFVMPTARYTAKRILNATMTRSGNEASDTGVLFEAGNPLDTDYSLLTSVNARNLAINGLTNNGIAEASAAVSNAAQADSMVLIGDFKKAFRWRQAKPPQFSQMPPNSTPEFTQDVILGVKSMVWGVACVKDPRFVVRAYNSSL